MPRHRLFWRCLIWLAAAWLLLCIIGEMISIDYPRRFRTCEERPKGPVVQLRGCTVPYLRVLAVHLHVLGLTFGIDFQPPAIKTPLGRLGFDE
jgi:hypothetical protein